MAMYREEGEDDNEVEIFENIKLQKEIIAGVRSEPWPIRRKLKTVRYKKSTKIKYNRLKYYHCIH